MISSLHASFLEAFRVSEDAFPVELFFEGETTVGDLASLVQRAAGLQTSDGVPLQPYVTCSWPVALVGNFMQVVGFAVPAIYLGASTIPVFLLISSQSLLVAALVAPVAAILYTLSSALLLITIRWLVLGRLSPGHTAVWSMRFAQRWIVRQCCRVCWRYTPWRFMNGTELLSVLHRSLGCKLGKGSHVDFGCMDDFDLVSVGSGTYITGFMNPADVSVGVLTLVPISIGSDCQLEDDCLIEMGSVIEHGVRVGPRCLVTRDSVLKKGSRWEGKPAVEVKNDAQDVENQVNQREKYTTPIDEMEVIDEFTGRGAPTDEECVSNQGEKYTAMTDDTQLFEKSIGPGGPPTNEEWVTNRRRYIGCQLLTLFAISPYLFTVELLLTWQVARLLLDNLGWLWTSLLIWLPFSASCFVATVAATVAKIVLLGKVHPGRWVLHGSFHRRKCLVDHLVEGHLLVWRKLAGLLGSPFVHSLYFSQETWKALAGGVGRSSSVHPHKMTWTAYDLVQIGNYNLWGGGSQCLPWSMKNGYLVGKKIESGDNCYVGTNSTVLGGVTLEDHATVAGFSIASEDVAGTQTVIGSNVITTNLETNGTHTISFMNLKIVSHTAGLVLWVGAAFVTGVTLALIGDSVIVDSVYTGYIASLVLNGTGHGTTHL